MIKNAKYILHLFTNSLNRCNVDYSEIHGHGFPGLFTDTSEHVRFILFSFSLCWLLVPCDRFT